MCHRGITQINTSSYVLLVPYVSHLYDDKSYMGIKILRYVFLFTLIMPKKKTPVSELT